MPWNNIRLHRGQFTFNNMQISPADRTNFNLDADFTTGGVRLGNLARFQW